MRTKLTIRAAAIMAWVVAMATHPSLANLTNTWNFSTPAQYQVSNPADIEVADGVAKLKLQAAIVQVGDLNSYFRNEATGENVSYGPDVLLRLATQTGGKYVSSANYISRVFDGGLANRWDEFRFIGYNTSLMNAGGEITTSMSGLRLLTHFNNSWVEDVSGLAGTVSGAGFSTSARLGSHSASFGSGDSYVQYSGTFSLGQKLTVAFWANLSSLTHVVAPMIASFWQGGTLVGWVEMGGTDADPSLGSGNMELVLNNVVARTEAGVITTADLNVWRHYAFVYDGSLPSSTRTKFYKDGVLQPLRSNALGTSAPTFNAVRIGGRGMSGQSMIGMLDEFAIVGLSLTDGQVFDLYSMPQSLLFQARSGSSTGVLSGRPFVGPDGTASTYYSVADPNLKNAGQFSRVDRYIQYKALLIGQTDGTQTPYLDSVGVIGSRASAFDNTVGDFTRAQSTTNLQSIPDSEEKSHIGLVKERNGGFLQSGTFTSRTMDAGASVFWDVLNWSSPSGTDATSDMHALWRMEGGWADATSPAINGSSIQNITYSANAKIGAQSAVFNGVSSSVTMAVSGKAVGAIDFWIKTPRRDVGLMDFGDGRLVRVRHRMLEAAGFGSATPTVFVNGQSQSRELTPGWNHVAIVWSPTFTPTQSLVIGRSGTDYFHGMLDEMALYSTSIDGGRIKTNYLKGGGKAAGRIRFQVRASNENPIPSSVAFVGPGNSETAYFTASGGSLPDSVWSKRYFQYRMYLDGDGDASPAVYSVRIQYSGAASGTASDTTASHFWQGSFGSGTRMIGTGQEAFDNSVVPGLVNLDPVNELGLEGLWHMDEETWPTGAAVIDSSANARHGNAQNGARPTGDARVGLRCGLFDGVNQYIVLPSVTLEGDFTFAAWFRTTANNRAAILARTDSGIILEINGNGSATAAGQAALVVQRGGVRRVAASGTASLNDGAWHHIAGVRRGRGVFLYIDGVRVGSALLTSGFGALGIGQLEVARNPETSLYLNGNVDEAMVYSRALTDAEIVQRIRAGGNNRQTVSFASPILDAGGPAIWETILWGDNTMRGVAMAGGAAALVGLWPLDDLTGGVTVDVSGAGHDGSLSGGYSSEGGKFGNALRLTGSGGVTIPHSPIVEPLFISLGAWIKMDDAESRAIVGKRNGSEGYALYTDASGRPVFWVAGTACTATQGLRQNEWTHIAGVYDGSLLRLYLNGRIAGVVAMADLSLVSGADLTFGFAQPGLSAFSGQIDEVFIYARVLGEEAVADMARFGMGDLRVQARAGNEPDLASALFVGSDGTTNSFFRNSRGSDMLGSIPLGRYFQFRYFLDVDDPFAAPLFAGATVYQSAYPTTYPWVRPAQGQGATFVGRLGGFSHVLAENTESAVRYQVSGTGTNWYWWNGGAWAPDTGGLGWMTANEAETIDAQIGTFYDQLYDKTGGSFYFRSFLRSFGNDQTAIDQVQLVYSRGRLSVTEPNGTEIDKKAWLVDAPYTIRWSSAGTVSNNLRLEYSRDGGLNWTLIANGVANTGSYPGWVTPPAPSLQMLVRIRDMNDTSIYDVSDSVFHITDTFQVKAPNGGETWFLSGTNTVRWAAPGPAAARGGAVDIYYAADGVTFDFKVAGFVPNTEASQNNTYTWYAVPGQPPLPLPSMAGRIRVHAADNTDPNFNGYDDSDEPFTLAGITIVQPTVGSYINNGSDVTLQWVSAAAGSQIAIDFSRNNGLTWTNVLASISNVNGSNSFVWAVNLEPSDTARLRMRSLSDARVSGVSSQFQLADVKITSPAAGDNWELRQNKVIRWESGGAGDRVDLYYSINGGATWTGIASNVFNTASNAFTWNVVPFPSGTAKIRVVSHADRINLIDDSPNFNIAGVRIAFPNGGEIWPRGGTDAIRWEHREAGSMGDIFVSLDGGVNWTYLGARGLANLSINWRPELPSARGLARIVAINPPDWAVNMNDVSDAFFTVGGVVVTSPTEGQRFTVGTTHPLTWTSAGSAESGGGELARIYYTTTGGGSSNFITEVSNNEIYPGNNIYNWNISDTISPSLTAQIIVAAGPFRGLSPVFTLRGIRFLTPIETTVFDIGKPTTIRWDHAGLDPSASGFVFVSSDGGVTFEGSAINATPIPVTWGSYDWQVPSNAVPSTQAVLKFVVQNSDDPLDLNYEVKSRPFVMRGLKIVEPQTGTVWDHGSTNAIHLIASRAGDFASFYYAADGVNFDMAAGREVRANWPLQDGHSFIPWVIERYRMPSVNARLKAVSTIATTFSESFTVRGIKVVRPFETDIWAAGETNVTTWVGVGTSGSYDVFVEPPGASAIQIGAGVSGPSLAWITTPDAVGEGVIVRVRDSANGFEGVSEPFMIVAEPTVIVANPQADALWRVTDTYSITWSKGGEMVNDFRVTYSSSPYTATNLIFDGAAAYDSDNNSYSVPWTVPDRLGATKIIVENNDRPAIRDESALFYIVGKFQVLFPNGGEQTLFARKPAAVRWYTWGSVPFVNLYYSVDPLHGPDSWVRINTDPVPVTGYGTEPSSYQWEVVDLGGAVATARIRVEQANRPGALDDSDADFPINYYQIVWHVLDGETGQHLNKLSVTESSGVSQSSLLSPIVRKYPWGYFDTVWSREFFFDGVAFNWLSEPSRTLTIVMKRSDVDPEFKVMANFNYIGGANDRLTIHAWLERSSQILPDPSRCTIYIYDQAGNSVTNLVKTQPFNTGVFRFDWDNVTSVLTRGDTYFAKVSLEYSGETYDSMVTYTLRLTAEDIQTQEVLDALGLVGTNLTDLADSQRLFRDATTASLANLQTSADAIGSAVDRIETNIVDRVMPSLDLLTNEVIGVISPAVTGTLAQVTALQAQVDERTARILTRDTTVILNSVNPIFYKSRPGHGGTVTIRVTSPNGATQYMSANMSEVVGGIYGYDLLANWGLGYFVVTCADPGGTVLDRITLRVVDRDLYDMPLMMTSMSNSLTRMEVEIAALSDSLGSVTNAAGQLELLVDSLGTLTNLDTLATAIQDLDLSALTNLTAFTADIEEIRVGVGDIQGALGALTNLSDIADAIDGLDLSALTNLTALTTDVDAIREAVTRIQSTSGAMSNELSELKATLEGVQWSALTNILSGVDGIQTSLGAITNLAEIADTLTDLNLSVLTNLTDVSGNIATLLTAVDGMAGSMGLLTNIQTEVSQLQLRLNVLTNMQAGIDSLMADMGSVTNLDAIASTLQGLDWSSLTNLTQIGEDIGSIQSRLNVLTNMQAELTSMSGSLSALTNLTEIADAINNIDVSALTNITNVAEDLSDVRTLVAGLAGPVGLLTNIQADVSQLQLRLNVLTNMQAGIDGIRADMGSITNLDAIASTLQGLDWSSLTNVTQIGDEISQIQTRLNVLTNLQSDLSSMQSSLSALTNLTEIADAINNIDVSALTNITSVAEDLSDVRTLVAGLAGPVGLLTNIQADVSQLQMRLNVLTNMQAGIDSIRADMGSITNLDAIASTLQGLDWSSLTNVTQIGDEISQIQTRLNVLTNLQADLSSMQSSMSALTNLTEIADAINNIDVSALTNVTQLASDLGRIETGVGALTNGLSALQSAFGSVQWNTLTNVPGIKEDVELLTSTLGGVSWESLTGISEQVNTITNALGRMDWNDVLALSQNISTVTSGVSAIRSVLNQITNLTEIADITSGTSRSVETLQGTLASLESSLSEVGLDASQAATKSRSARTAADNAVAGIARLQEEVTKGDMEQAFETLQAIQSSLGNAREYLSEIPKLVGPSNYHEKMMSVAKEIEDLASRGGWKNFLTLEDMPEGEGGVGVGREEIGTLSRNLAEMKSSMSLMHKLMDEKINEPVVEETLLGVE